MSKQKKIWLLSGAGLVILGVGFCFYYPQYREDQFYKEAFGASKYELRAKLTDQASIVSLYLKTSTTDADANTLMEIIRAEPWVKSVAYTSADQALVEFKKKHENDQTLNQALAELKANPLLPTVKIHAIDCLQVKKAEALMQNPTFKNSVNQILYSSISCEKIDEELERSYSAAKNF